MRTTILTFALLAATGGSPLLAQPTSETAGPPESGAAALARVRETLPGVHLSWYGDRISRVYGRPLANGLSAWDAAEAFRLGAADVFGVPAHELIGEGLDPEWGPIQPVMFERSRGDYKFMLVRYVQVRDGVRVFRADLRVLVRNEPDFPAVLAASALRDLGAFSPARAAINSQLDPTGVLDQPFERFSPAELVIWAGNGRNAAAPCLAYALVAARGAPDESSYAKWLYVVDAATGAILYKEDQIIFTDVTGNVGGLATPGPKADICAPELSTPMPYAEARIGSTTVYADANGDFTVPNGGSVPVTVTSPMTGLFFEVDNLQGDEETLNLVVTPPGPANFVHNAANNSESVRAQVNSYIQANIVRDFCLFYNPSYPTIAGQTHFPVRVMSTDATWCPGNAWYDGGSLTFCAAGSGYSNYAFSNIVHHEYGHHIVGCGGSEQGAYGEGMGDVVGMLIADDPVHGYGADGDCNAGHRTADNDLQYPCGGEIHYCGQLISGCIWSTRNELANTHPADYLEILSNLTINSILLHDGDQITPDITIDFLTLDDDNSDIYDGTPHCEEICAGFGAHDMGCPAPLDVSCHATWVDFAYSGLEDGSFMRPYNTVAEGVSHAPAGGTLMIKAGTSAETATITKTMTIRAFGGPVTIGGSAT
jgi:hypothetical protein